MAYTKRNNIPRNWPVRKKGSKYVVTPKSKGIPLTIVFREILGICENRKEVKKAMNMKRIIVNGKEIRDERNCVDLFDKITILPMRINYQISLSKTGKYSAEKIDKKENPSLSFYNNITQKTNDLDKMITRLNLLQEMKTDLQHTLKKARKYIENN
jgi:small subunit ribosomal protein S4e